MIHLHCFGAVISRKKVLSGRLNDIVESFVDVSCNSTNRSVALQMLNYSQRKINVITSNSLVSTNEQLSMTLSDL